MIWGLISCLEHSISIISHRLRFAITRWDNFDRYTWTLIIYDVTISKFSIQIHNQNETHDDLKTAPSFWTLSYQESNKDGEPRVEVEGWGEGLPLGEGGSLGDHEAGVLDVVGDGVVYDPDRLVCLQVIWPTWHGPGSCTGRPSQCQTGPAAAPQSEKKCH